MTFIEKSGQQLVEQAQGAVQNVVVGMTHPRKEEQPEDLLIARSSDSAASRTVMKLSSSPAPVQSKGTKIEVSRTLETTGIQIKGKKTLNKKAESWDR